MLSHDRRHTRLDSENENCVCDILTLNHSSAYLIAVVFSLIKRGKKRAFDFVSLFPARYVGQSCCVHRDSEMFHSVSSSSLSWSDSDDLLYPFASTEARRLYWTGRLRVSIDLLQSQSQLDLLGSPYLSLRHRSRSLFNISQDGPSRQEAKESFSIDLKRRPLRQSKVIKRQGQRSRSYGAISILPGDWWVRSA